MSKRTQAHIFLIGTTLIWGATFPLVKSALADTSPLLFNALRFTLAALALTAINHRHLRALTRTHLALGALTGLFLAAGYQFQTLGLARTSPTKSAFITGLVVVLVPMFTIVPIARPPGTSRPGLPAASGALLAFTGLIFLTTPAGTRAGDLLTTVSVGDALTLLCAIAFAAHLLTLGRASKVVAPGLLATLQIAFAAMYMVVATPFQHEHLTPTPRLFMTLAITALLGTAAAFTIQSFAQQVLPPTHTVLILTLEPVFAWLTSLLFLGDHLAPRALLGAALILAGIALTELLPITNSTEIPA